MQSTITPRVHLQNKQQIKKTKREELLRVILPKNVRILVILSKWEDDFINLIDDKLLPVMCSAPSNSSK